MLQGSRGGRCYTAAVDATAARRSRWGRRAAGSALAGATVVHVLRVHRAAEAAGHALTAEHAAIARRLCANGHLRVRAHLAMRHRGDDLDMELTGEAHPGAALVDPESLPLADGTVSSIRATHVLDHTLGADAVLRELRRVLREGGTVEADVANAAARDGTSPLSDPIGVLTRIDAGRGRAQLSRRRLIDGDTADQPRIDVPMTHAELLGLLRETGFEPAPEDVRPGLRRLLAPRLSARGRATSTARTRPLQPWWPAMVGRGLPVDYLGPRPEVAALVPADCRTALDLGCAAGSLGMTLEERGIRVTGVEADDRLASMARTVLTDVVVGDITDVLRTGSGLDAQGYDAIVAADVLEHLSDPWAALRQVVSRLRPGGCVVLSLPNVRHWDTLWNLGVRGVWPQRASGIHDRTHLRWFTRRSVADLLEGARLQPEVMTSVRRVREARTSWMDGPARWLPGVLGELVSFQWLVRARRPA